MCAYRLGPEGLREPLYRIVNRKNDSGPNLRTQSYWWVPQPTQPVRGKELTPSVKGPVSELRNSDDSAPKFCGQVVR